MNIAASALRFGAKILIERSNRGGAFRVAHHHISEFVDDFKPETAAQIVEPKVQPFAKEGRYIVGLLTGSDYDEFERRQEAVEMDLAPQDIHGRADAFRALEDSYFTTEALANFEPEAALKRIQDEISGLSA